MGPEQCDARSNPIREEEPMRSWLRSFALSLVCTAALFAPLAGAQNPIKIGLGIAHTGPLAGGGKAALLALQMWRDDVNTRGGLLGRKVELIAYDDQSS